MLRNYKLVVSIIGLTLTSVGAFAQAETEAKVEYKDVTLDGKPAKLNIATGEITFVNPNDKKAPVKFDDFVAESENRTNTIKKLNSNKNKTKQPIASTTSSKPASETIGNNVNSDFYIVKANETLLDISKTYGVSLTELKRVNNLETTLINKGQKLQVKNLDAYAEVDSQDNNNSSYNSSYSESSNTNFHTVEKNNTLFSLARRYNLSVAKLKSLNNLKSNLIYVGQKLRVVDSKIKNEDNSNWTWTVAKGDTLYSIALKNNISIDNIKTLNGLTSNLIKVGQILRLK